MNKTIKEFIKALVWFLLSTGAYVFLFIYDWRIGLAILAIQISHHGSVKMLLKQKAGIEI